MQVLQYVRYSHEAIVITHFFACRLCITRVWKTLNITCSSDHWHVFARFQFTAVVQATDFNVTFNASVWHMWSKTNKFICQTMTYCVMIAFCVSDTIIAALLTYLLWRSRSKIRKWVLCLSSHCGLSHIPKNKFYHTHPDCLYHHHRIFD